MNLNTSEIDVKLQFLIQISIGNMLFQYLGLLSLLTLVCAYPATFDQIPAEELEREFQGDMIISQAELDAFNGRIDERLRWPNNIVPYYVDPTHFSTSKVMIAITCWLIRNVCYSDAEQIAYIHKAADTLNAIGCVQLVQRTNQADYITVSGDATGCSSFVGRIGGSQTLKLAPNGIESGCFRLYTIVHEFIHALGFHHMQSSVFKNNIWAKKS